MKIKKIIFIAFLLAVISCSKDNKVACYECQKTYGSTNYSDVGCYTNEAWNQMYMTDNLGNDIDKNTKCRKK